MMLWVLLTLAQGVDPVGAGMDPAKLGALKPNFQKFVDDHHLSGAVTLVARRGKIAGLETVGFLDLKGKEPMKADTIFRIASMTKPITAIGIMMLEDEGKLSVDDPLEKHLPEFKGQMLVKSRDGGSVMLVKPARPITLKDLLTHTSGLPGSPPPGLSDLYSRRHKTLSEAVMAFSQRPLDFEPGSKWSYCNTGIDTLGRVIEAVSGMSYEQFLHARLFVPLGMIDTVFYIPEDQLPRVAPLYDQKEGKLVRTQSFLADPSEGKYPIPAGGLYSTAPDLAKVYQMLLDRGVSGGKRYLTEAAVEKMTRLHTGELTAGFTDGVGFGLGVGVVREPKGVTEMLSPGTYGHGGAFGTQGWIDPKREMFFILMIQRVGLKNGDASDFRRELQATAVSAIVN